MSKDFAPIESVLHEATEVLNTALKHSTELSEVGVSSEKLLRMRLLITRITVHSYTSLNFNSNLPKEIQELQKVKEIVLKMAEQRFGNTSRIFSEFQKAAQKKLN
jgi:hypothetical protein